MTIRVTANHDETIACLKQGLTADEFALLKAEQASSDDPLAPAPRRAEPLSTTVLIWISATVASGVTYDVIKAVTHKAYNLLKQRFGASNVQKDDNDG